MNDQGTEAWLQDRLGMVTASRMADVMATIKSGEAAARANYRAELVAQRLTGNIEAGFTNAAMDWGTQHESFARAHYELLRGLMVTEVGFIKHPKIKWSGASPDGLVGMDGLVEIKCPNTATHIDYLLKNEVPAKYRPQMLWQMACTGRAWCDFVSFDPRLPAPLDLFVTRFRRDDEKVGAMETEVVKFIDEIETILALLKNRVDEIDLATTP